MKNNNLSKNEKAFMRVYRGEIYDPVRPGCNIDITPAQAVFIKGAPLTSFGNPVMDDFQSDLFQSIILTNIGFKASPPQEREANALLLEWLLNDPKFNALRVSLSGLLISSAMAANEVVRQLLDDDEMSTSMQMLSQAGNMQQKADDLESAADKQEGDGDDQDDDQQDDENEGQGQGGGDSDDEQDDESGGQGSDDDDDGDGDQNDEQEDDTTPEEKRRDAEELRKQASESQKQAEKKLREMMAKRFSSIARAGAVSKAQQAGNETHAFLASWGLDESKPYSLNVETLRRLMEAMTRPGLSNIAQLMGRIYSAAARVLTGRAPQQIAVDKYGLTKKVGDVRMSDLAMMTDVAPEELRREFIARFVTRGLPGRTKSMQAKNEGIFVGAVDRSGSMSAPIRTGNNQMSTRAEVAMALVLGMSRAAKENGQPFTLFGFATDVHKDLVSDLSGLDQILSFATRQDGGGTDFDKALLFAEQIVMSFDEDERMQTDILMVTDGMSDISDRTKNVIEILRERYQVRLHVLLIGQRYDGYSDIVDLADNVIEFSNLDDIAEVLSKAVFEN